MNQNEPIIGILGGMGPYAGIDLFKKIHQLTLAKTDQEHLSIALLSYPSWICDRSTFLFDQSKPSPVPALSGILERLDGAGATHIGMPCNTAHAPPILNPLLAALRESRSGCEFVHMPNETARFVSDRGFKTVGVLGTTAIQKLGLYKTALKSVGVEALRPSPDLQQNVVNPVIFDRSYGIKAQSNPVSERARNDLLHAIRKLKAAGAEAIILGCTEFPLALPSPEACGLPLIDPTTELARALIRKTAPEKLRERTALPAE